MADLKDMLGKVLVEVEVKKDCEIIFKSQDGKRWKLYHQQDCCESVYIESIVGDLRDLVGAPLLIAEEVSGEIPEDFESQDESYESYTWTFYKFATRKGYVDVRWLGESNGYYSESVDFVLLP